MRWKAESDAQPTPQNTETQKGIRNSPKPDLCIGICVFSAQRALSTLHSLHSLAQLTHHTHHVYPIFKRTCNMADNTGNVLPGATDFEKLESLCKRTYKAQAGMLGVSVFRLRECASE
jgi:hypothetical protein